MLEDELDEDELDDELLLTDELWLELELELELDDDDRDELELDELELDDDTFVSPRQNQVTSLIQKPLPQR